MEITQIISLVALGVFLLFLSFGFLIGLIRGLKKASLRFAVFVGTTITAFLITPLVSKFALDLDLSFVGLDGSLKDYIQTMINDQPQIADFLSSSATMQSFVEKIPYLVLNLVSFFVIFIAISFVGFIVYQILKSIFLRKKKPKQWKDGDTYKVAFEDKKPGKHRFLGGLMGAVQGLAFMAILLLPVSGFASLAYDLTFQGNVANAAVQNYSPTALLIQENLPTEVLQGIKIYKTSPIGITSSLIGADTFMFDALTKVKIETQEGNFVISYRSEAKNFSEIYNNLEFLLKLDFDNLVYKNLDYNKIEKAVDILFDSKLLSTLAPEVLNWALLDINKPNVDQTLNLELGETELSWVNKITSEYENKFGSVYGGLKNDLKVVVKVAVGAGKSGLVDEALSQTMDLDEIKDILQDNNKEVINTTFSNLFKAVSLRVLAVEAINIGLENFSDGAVDFSLVSYDKVNWDGVISDVTIIANNLLDMLVSVSDQFSGGIEEVINENPYELLYADTTVLTTKLGVIMSTLQNTNLLVDANGNKVVYNQFMDYLNTTEIAEYIDFQPFKQANAWQNEMANLDTILLSIKRSMILPEIINNIDNLDGVDFNSILQKISDIDSENSKTYTYNILNSILSSNAFKKVINIGFDMLNELIEDNQETLGSGVVLGKLQGNKLSTEQEKVLILSFFDNIVSYASELGWNGSDSELLNAILSSNLSKLGVALDAIKNSAIFGEYTEDGTDYDGVYVSLITALNNFTEISDFVNFAIVLDESFEGWNSEFTKIQTILENLQSIDINGKSLINTIIDGDDLTSIISELTTEDIDSLIDPIIESQLLSKNITLFVDMINQMVADFTNTTINSVSTQEIIAQKEDVKAVIKKALELTGVLTDGFEEDDLIDSLDILGGFLNILKDNKTTHVNAVFGETYDALVNYFVDELGFDGMLTQLLDYYEDQDDIDWQELFEMLAEMLDQDFEQGFSEGFKTKFANVFSTMKQDENYQEIAVEAINFIESFTNIDTFDSFADFYTNALSGLATAQNNSDLSKAEYASRVGVVFDFFNDLLPLDDFDISSFKNITDYSAEIESANNFESAMASFEDIDFDNDDINDINDMIDELIDSLATSQLLFDLLEDLIEFDNLDSNAKIIIEDRIDNSAFTPEMKDRLNAFFGII